MSTATPAPPPVEVAEPSVRIPTSWFRLMAPLVVGLLLGGGGATGAGILQAGVSAAEFATWTEEHSAAETHPGAVTHDDLEGLASADDVADLLFLVCQLAAQNDPPIRDRRCE